MEKINNNGTVFSFNGRSPDSSGNIAPANNDYLFSQIEMPSDAKLEDIKNIRFNLVDPNNAGNTLYPLNDGYVLKYFSTPDSGLPAGFYPSPDLTGLPSGGTVTMVGQVGSNNIALSDPSGSPPDMAEVEQSKFFLFNNSVSPATPTRSLTSIVSDYQ